MLLESSEVLFKAFGQIPGNHRTRCLEGSNGFASWFLDDLGLLSNGSFSLELQPHPEVV